ncbi:hypothetical protein HII13_005079 [Brettanomyces bruxellensis]|uniref:Uncharacterized protein n=1 Tax=Dekkera bruxellensis TaxID=5007 RepID=A0A8H6EQK8_DEKBR|nr:hypothetical protein HII13_005079 [Brettanomyces bruxellensis]KAF6006699.1 hypothetical protein HII12_004891 [Brettanomyces bruxellensis]
MEPKVRHRIQFGRRPRKYRPPFKSDDDQVKTVKKRLKVVMKPSGILNYSHLQGPKYDAKTFYTPPEDEFEPENETGYHVFKFDDLTKDEVEVPLLIGKSYITIGRDSDLADLALNGKTDDESVVSKRHAVLQFRRSKDSGEIKLYILDLDSTNGTFLNESKTELPKQRYIELKDKDRLKFGDYNSHIEFVILKK